MLLRDPILADVIAIHEACDGAGTNEETLFELLGRRSNEDMHAIIHRYQSHYHRSLESTIKGEFHGKEERLYVMLLAGQRAPNHLPVNQAEVEQDVAAMQRAARGIGTDEITQFRILTTRNDHHLRAVFHRYHQLHGRKISKMLKSEYSGTEQKALLHIYHSVKDPIRHDARLLEKSMAGMGTKDIALLRRVVRNHWDVNRWRAVQAAYQLKYRKDLVKRIKGETSGDFERVLVALCEQ